MTLARSWRLALLAGLLAAPVGAQQTTGTIRGRVVDAESQQPIPRVSVVVGGRSTVTSNEGRYVIADVPQGFDSVRARIIGYAPMARPATIQAGQTLEIDFALTPRAINLAEMVVVGYGEQAAGTITGAVTQINAEQFNPGRVVSPGELIQARVPGIQVVDNNEPGGSTVIRVRGPTSQNASSDPLYVVDGIPLGTGSGGGLSSGRDPLNFLNPRDIASITVLKDASAAAIYGANAANGVVLITTRRGGRAGTQVEYSGSFSAASVTRLPSIMNAAQFRTAIQNLPAGAQRDSALAQLGTATTNWLDLVTRTAYGAEHNVSVAGATDNSAFRLSLGYLDQEGILRSSSTQRTTIGANIDQRLFSDRLSVRATLLGSRAIDEFTPGGVLSNATQYGPTQPVSDPATTTGFYEWPGNRLQSADNPLAILANVQDRATTMRGVGNLRAEYRLPWLANVTATTNVGFDIVRADRRNYTPAFMHSETKQPRLGYSYQANQRELNTLFDFYLNWAPARTMGPGLLDLTAGYSYSHNDADRSYYDITGIPATTNIENILRDATSAQYRPNPQESKLVSFFGRANYNINDRYLAAFTLRRDASSRFGPTNRWGTFPALSVAWRLSEEAFMPRFWGMSDLKLRAAWARTGNQSFGNYLYYSTYVSGDQTSQYPLGGTYYQTLRPSAVDKNIRWEQTTSFNLGLDYAFRGSRFSGTFDWYTKNTDDLIFDVLVPAGFTLSNHVITNVGSMRNRGVEFSLSARLLDSRDRRSLRWTADFTASHNSNEMTSINPYVGDATIIPTGDISGGVGGKIQVLTPGQPINSFYVCRQAYDTDGSPLENQYYNANDSVVTGCSALRPYHDPAPKWIFGHTSTFGYGNFDASFTLRSYIGNYVYNNVSAQLGASQELTRGSPYNLHTSQLESGFFAPQYYSDYYIENGSFLRMDNITVGYSFAYRGQAARLFATLQNAFTITGYSGVDPTAGLNGIDNNMYPRSRTLTTGLTVRF